LSSPIHVHLSFTLCTFRPSALKDLESLEPAFYNSLLWIQQNDPEPLDLTFTVEEEAFGQLTTHELKPGGLDTPVTEENKHEYIDLMIKWRLDQGVAMQMESLRKGFSEVCASSVRVLRVLRSLFAADCPDKILNSLCF